MNTKSTRPGSKRIPNWVLLTLAALGLVSWSGSARAQDIDSMPPVVVRTVPEAGSTNVSPGVVEIKVTYSKEMRDRSWSWSSAWQGSEPEVVEPPKYEADGRTCVLKVRLKPNTAYGYWLNSPNFKNFKDRQGRPAVAYLLTFQTKTP